MYWLSLKILPSNMRVVLKMPKAWNWPVYHAQHIGKSKTGRLLANVCLLNSLSDYAVIQDRL